MAYTLTPARRAALKRAQAASAARRRGKGKGKLAAAHRALGAKGPQGKFAGKKGLAKKVAGIGAIAASAVAAGYGGHHFQNAKKKTTDTKPTGTKPTGTKPTGTPMNKQQYKEHKRKVRAAVGSEFHKTGRRTISEIKAAKKHLK